MSFYHNQHYAFLCVIMQHVWESLVPTCGSMFSWGTLCGGLEKPQSHLWASPTSMTLLKLKIHLSILVRHTSNTNYVFLEIRIRVRTIFMSETTSKLLFNNYIPRIQQKLIFLSSSETMLIFSLFCDWQLVSRPLLSWDPCLVSSWAPIVPNYMLTLDMLIWVGVMHLFCILEPIIIIG